ncbi:chloride channel protein [Candidatus Undinarchaeota archaeon]
MHRKVIFAIKHNMEKVVPHRGTFILYTFAMFVGLAGGLGAVFFDSIIEFTSHIFREIVANALVLQLGNIGNVFVPMIGGLIVGTITYYFAKETAGHGIPEVMEAVLHRKGEIRVRVPVIKALVSAITIGSGGSSGREGPIAQIGAGIGSGIGKIFDMSDEDKKLLATCGLAAGIAGSFDAPLGGALFAVEILHRRMSKETLIPVILSSVLGAAIAEQLLGRSHAFNTPEFIFSNIGSLFNYMILGIICGIAGVLWVKSYYSIERGFEKVKLPIPYKAAIGGFLVGLIGLWFPQIMGVGYDTVELVLFGGFSIGVLLVLAVLKALATGFTLGSGGSGGVFSPTVYIGTMIGGALGLFFSNYLSFGISDPMVYALVGMGAFFTAVTKAPLTGIIFISEISGNYHLLLPLMFSCALSYFIFSIFSESDIYGFRLKLRGLKPPSEKLDILTTIRVENVMNKKVSSLAGIRKANKVKRRISKGEKRKQTDYPVTEKGKVIGIVKRSAIEKVPYRNNKTQVIDLMESDYKILYPDNTVKEALDLMEENNQNMLPVVERLSEKKLIGTFTRRDLMRAYREAMD